jgi:hypothetical protein
MKHKSIMRPVDHDLLEHRAQCRIECVPVYNFSTPHLAQLLKPWLQRDVEPPWPVEA